MNEQELLLALAEEAVQARRNGLTLILDGHESLLQLRRLWRAADRVIDYRDKAKDPAMTEPAE